MKSEILVITKNSFLKQDVIKALEKDYKVLQSDISGYIECIKNNEILCILDYTDDFNTIDTLKSNEISKLIPVIILSSIVDKKRTREYLNRGAYDFVDFPIDKKVINLKINDAINVLTKPKSLLDRPSFDRLCDIFNAETLFREIRKELDNREENDKFHLVRFDVNKFTMINYFFGVKYGEDVLKFIAKQLSIESLTFNITYGRMSKDIFAFLLKGSDEDLKKIVRNIKAAVKGLNSEYDIELTFGVFDVFDYNMDISQMLSYATLAAKKIKGIIGPDYISYSEKLRNDIALEQSYISSFDNALKKKEFIIYLQPKYDIIMEKIVGAEALVRWGMNGRIISPGEFIPIFERNGLIDKLDRYVWEETVKYIRWRMDHNLPLFGISVNVSRIFLSMNNFIDDIVALVKKYDVPTRLLELEITESIFSDVNLIKDTVKKLREKGFKILMDDFGSGYSGLNVLKEVDFDALKIDLRFFSRNDKKSQDIIKSVLDIAHAIDIPAIAEGVETKEYIDLLKTYGCNYAQGFYYSKPIPIKDFNRLCEKDCINYSINDDKYLNIKHIENSINEFLEYAKDYSFIDDTAVNNLLESFRKEVNVDLVYLNIASANGDKCIFTNNAYKDKKYDLAGKEIPITLEEYASQCMLYDDEGLSEIPGMQLENAPYKSIIYFGLTRGNYTDGTVGMVSYTKTRKWSVEERKALKLLGRCLQLVVYRKRNEIIRIANNKREMDLKKAYDDIRSANAEIKYILSLIISSLNGINVRIIKYNFNKNIGCYYKDVDGMPYIVNDNTVFETLCSFYDNAIEKPDINFRADAENLAPGVIKKYMINSYECLGRIEPDTKVHTTSIRIQAFEESGEKIIVALLVDSTELLMANHKEVVDVSKLNGALASVLTNNLVDLTVLDLETKKIHKYSKKDNQIYTRIINTSWEKLIKTELGFIVDDDIRTKFSMDLAYENVIKMTPYETIRYKYKSKYDSENGLPRNFSGEAKVIINPDNSKSLVVYTTDITKAVEKENRINKKIHNLQELASHDALTEIHNRLGLEFNIDKIKEMVQPDEKQYILIMDVDYFKEINDKYGHLEGDNALKCIAAALIKICEKYKAFAYRFGGDEFVLLISIKADFAIENISEEINAILAEKASKYNIKVTCGIASADYEVAKNATLESITDLIGVADRDLMKKKKEVHN